MSSSPTGNKDELIDKVIRRIETDPLFVKEVFHSASSTGRQNLVRPLSAQVGRVLSDEFAVADIDGNQQLSHSEIRNWYKRKYPAAGQPLLTVSTASREASFEQLEEGASGAVAAEPSTRQHMQLAVQAGIPFIGFGFLDNVIMLTAGNQIEASMGVALGLSPLMAAGIGNLISDVAGLKAGGAIEIAAAKMGLPDPGLSAAQLKLSSVKRTTLWAGALGISLGCIIGMCPLLFIDEKGVVLREIFDEIDKDSSGTISEQELFQALAAVGVKRDTVHELMKQADLDGSRDIDFEEFRHLYRMWKAGAQRS